jgi:hypothetical protein
MARSDTTSCSDNGSQQRFRFAVPSKDRGDGATKELRILADLDRAVQVGPLAMVIERFEFGIAGSLSRRLSQSNAGHAGNDAEKR